MEGLFIAPERLQSQYAAIKTTVPTDSEVELSTKLGNYMTMHFPLETEENILRRSVILSDLRKLFRSWVKEVCIDKGLSQEMADDAGGHIFVSGSYRLGVNEPGADIDTICIAPTHITRADFFSTLKDRLELLPKITNLVTIEDAIVPLITFDYDEINIDLQIAILPLNTIPESLNLLDDDILKNVDSGSEKSLNGPRVTELMIKLIPNRDSFIKVLRILRRWAKRRGLYSNKLGYLGGINWCILTLFINQLYPTASPVTLLQKFFMVLSTWSWPAAIQLTKTYDANLGLQVWTPSGFRNRQHVMPILTPAYPSMNSSMSVSELTLSVMKDEFKRGLECIERIIASGGENWDEFFSPSDFFAIHQHYLAVDIYAENEKDQQAWCGFCESRLRKLVDSLAYNRPLRRLRVYTQKFPLSFITDENKLGVSFFVAFDVDKHMMHNSKEVRIDNSVDYFKQKDLYGWNNRKDGMDVKITPVLWKNLPDMVFETLGGRENARGIRSEFMKVKKEKLEAAVLAAAAVAAPILQQKRQLEEPSTDENQINKASKLDKDIVENDDATTASEDSPVQEDNKQLSPTAVKKETNGAVTEEKDSIDVVKVVVSELVKKEASLTADVNDFLTSIPIEQPSAETVTTIAPEPVKVKKQKLDLVSSRVHRAPVKAAKMKISFGKK